MDLGGAGQEKLGRKGCVSGQPRTMQGSSYQILNLLESFFPAYLELGMGLLPLFGNCSCPQQFHARSSGHWDTVYLARAWPGIVFAKECKVVAVFLLYNDQGSYKEVCPAPWASRSSRYFGDYTSSKAK